MVQINYENKNYEYNDDNGDDIDNENENDQKTRDTPWGYSQNMPLLGKITC